MRQRTSMLDVYLERVMWEACSASVAFAPRTPCKPAIQVHGIKLLSGKAASPEVLRQNHVHLLKEPPVARGASRRREREVIRR